MYLISVYFDEATDCKMRGYMKQIAKHTGNAAMLEDKVPPHITIGAFRTESEETARDIFRRITEQISKGEVHWVTVGSFLPNVIYLSPILNEYLQMLSDINKKELNRSENVWIDKRYEPYSWYPHTTLGKKLTKEQLLKAFEVLQNQFAPFRGQVVKIGLAATNPYRDLEVYKLK